MPSLRPTILTSPLPSCSRLTIPHPTCPSTGTPSLDVYVALSEPHYPGSQTQSTLSPPQLPNYAHSQASNFSVASSSLRLAVSLSFPAHKPPPVYPSPKPCSYPPPSSYHPAITSYLLAVLAPSHPTSPYPPNSTLAVSIAVLTPPTPRTVHPLPHILNCLQHALLASPFFQVDTLGSFCLLLRPGEPLALDPALEELRGGGLAVTATLDKAGAVAQVFAEKGGEGGGVYMGVVAVSLEKVRGMVGKVLYEATKKAVEERMGLGG
jgi:hypothetical protein